MWQPYRALYIHIPFCKKRCLYCDFETDAVPCESSRIDEYFDNLILQIRRHAKAGDLSHIQTVFIGGGTPSYVGLRRLTSLLQVLGISLDLNACEVTMEANPDSISEGLVKDIYALGVNRLSIGVQSFDDEILHKLGRIHNAYTAQRAIDIAHTRFDNVSVDMMCGIPGQTGEIFCDGLRRAVHMGVSHVSVYPLMIEEGTPLARMCKNGTFPTPNQDAQAMFMQMAASALEPLGLHRYEVASYAKPGYACAHNISYWTGIPYLGIGRSAVTMRQNESHRQRLRDGNIEDDLDRRQMAAEDAMLAMRMTQGLSDVQVQKLSILLPKLLLTLDDLYKKHLLTHDHGRWKPTLGGWLCGNDLYEPLYALAP